MTHSTRSVRFRRGALASALLCLLAAAPQTARAASEQELRSLDEQVQEIKSDVLGIAAELGALEERLLYPSNTQVAIFVDLAEGVDLELDSVQLELDGEPVARHIYTYKELEALRRGGVQRIYTGNLATGEHQLQVTVAGRLGSGRGYSGSRTLRFDKEVAPKLVGLTLTGGSGESAVELGDW